jgi:homoserine O-acetyltransferase
MNAHDVGRDRGGVAAGLGMVSARTLVAAVSSDRLYPPEQQAELVAGIPGAGPLRIIDSPYGHDGFLIEAATVGGLLRELLAS